MTNLMLASPDAEATLRSTVQVTRTKPFAVNLTAFPIRFINTKLRLVLAIGAVEQAYLDECDHSPQSPLKGDEHASYTE